MTYWGYDIENISAWPKQQYQQKWLNSPQELWTWLLHSRYNMDFFFINVSLKNLTVLRTALERAHGHQVFRSSTSSQNMWVCLSVPSNLTVPSTHTPNYRDKHTYSSMYSQTALSQGPVRTFPGFHLHLWHFKARFQTKSTQLCAAEKNS